MSLRARIQISKLYTFILIVFPLIYSYELVGVSPTLLFVVIESALALICIAYNRKVKVDNRAWIYLFYMFFSATIGIMNSDNNSFYSLMIKSVLYILSFFVFYIFSWQLIDFKFLTQLYIRIGVILSVLVMIQFLFSILGKGFSMIPPGLPLAGVDGVFSDNIRAVQMSNNRFSTIFLEPSHQCEYLLPCLALLLFREEKKKRMDVVLAIIITVGFFCTTSSLGIFSSAILWTYYVINILRKRKASNYLYLLALAPLLLVIVVFFLKFEFVNTNLLARLAVLNVKNTSRTEGFRRIRYGWYCYADLGIFQKIFGAGYRNFGYCLANTGIGYKYLGTNDIEWISYTNGITGMLIGIGLFGTLLNLRLFLVDCIKTKNTLIYGFLLTWAIIMFTSNSFDDIIGAMPMILAMTVTFKQKEMKNGLRLVAGELI